MKRSEKQQLRRRGKGKRGGKRVNLNGKKKRLQAVCQEDEEEREGKRMEWSKKEKTEKGNRRGKKLSDEKMSEERNF